MWDRIHAMRRRFDEIEAEMATPEVVQDFARLQGLAKERSQLEPVVALLTEHEQVEVGLTEAEELLRSESDPEMREMVASEVETLRTKQADLEERARRALIPRDPNDERNVIIEVRAGAGGDEGGLWAADLYRAYVRFAERQRWKADVVSISENAAGGFKEIIFEIQGDGAYSRFKYESGVHRVQRVPSTESQGRIHTSTATVAVLPEVEEVDFHIDESDIRMDRFHSGGAGGQNVNKVETGIRLTHEPTGLVVTCTDERSQLKNRLKAMSVLRARLYEIERQRQEQEMAEARRSQVGTGDRAEKIRTYNYPENRITDHRIGFTTHSLPQFLDGDLDELVDAMVADDEARALQVPVA